jgi:hypothetical protein
LTANTAPWSAPFRRPSGEFIKAVRGNPRAGGLRLTNQVPAQGALPIKVVRACAVRDIATSAVRTTSWQYDEAGGAARRSKSKTVTKKGEGDRGDQKRR